MFQSQEEAHEAGVIYEQRLAERWGAGGLQTNETCNGYYWQISLTTYDPKKHPIITLVLQGHSSSFFHVRLQVSASNQTNDPVSKVVAVADGQNIETALLTVWNRIRHWQEQGQAILGVGAKMIDNTQCDLKETPVPS